MRGRTAIAVLLLVVVVAHLPGCAKPIIINAFDGPDRPDAEVATLEVDFKIRLTKLDGRPVAGVPAGLNEHEPTNPRVIRLLPGQHEFLVGKRPYVQTHQHPIHGFAPSGDCNGGMRMTVTGYYTTTSHVPGSRTDERLSFTAAPGRRYTLTLEDPLDWFAKRDRWRAKVIDRSDRFREPVVSTSYGYFPHMPPMAEPDPASREQTARIAEALARLTMGPRPTTQASPVAP